MICVDWHSTYSSIHKWSEAENSHQSVSVQRGGWMINGQLLNIVSLGCVDTINSLSKIDQ